jgi:threonine/homoserine/homoserine lactone efflux protein
MRSGFISGLGTATADAIYGCVAAFGVTAVGAFLADYQPALRLGGGLFLIYLGYGILKARPPELASIAGGERLSRDYASAFVLTLTNPLTIMSFAAVFAGLGIGETGGNYRLALLMVAGVFTGSALWWLILAGIANSFRTRLDSNKLVIVNRFSGCLIIGFGILSILSV